MDINYKKNGAAEINGMIKAAVEDRSRTAVVRGNYEIEDTIVIPSDFTLILDGCRLRMADGTFGEGSYPGGRGPQHRDRRTR